LEEDLAETTGSSLFLPLGSALVIDWKHLGRPQSARGATAWVTRIEGEPVLVRAWGEDTTSFFDFVFLADERLAGNLVVACSRSEPGKMRIKTAIEIEGQIAWTETSEFKEHPRTLLLTPITRQLDVKVGPQPIVPLPPLTSECAELFEVAPDGAMQNACGAWIVSLLRAVRDHLHGKEAPAAPPVRLKTENLQVRPSNPRQTLDGPVPTPKPDGNSSDGVQAAAPTPSKSKPRLPVKLLVNTNTGESYEIAAEETFVGRSKQCAIVLKSQRVSRKHACITKENDGFYINDIGAANGIWQGSEKIDRERIKPGDQYIIGDIVLSFSYA
jgi:hypothetical protein